jgi:hypothetical protein
MNWKSLISTNSSLNEYIATHSTTIGMVMAYALLGLFVAFIWYNKGKFLDFYAEFFAKWQYKIWKMEEKWQKRKQEKQQQKKDSDDSSME